MRLLPFFARFKSSVRGATAVEYALICALLFLAMVLAWQNVGTSTASMWNNVRNNVVR
jgi:pilus assembly protein Flp/PilA